MKKLVAWMLVAAGVTYPATPAAAQQATTIRVRVVSHDAKIVGSGVGGARVYIKNAATGEVLAEGIQEGGTGNTTAIVVEPVPRGKAIYDTEGAAVFTAELELAEPTVLEFVGEGPLGYEHAIQSTTKTMLVVPGQHVLGNGVVLELNGFIVEMLEPADETNIGNEVQVKARVRMMCGCPLEPGGLWDADRVRVSARVYYDGSLVKQQYLEYGGEPNIFVGTLSLGGAPEGASLLIVAADPTRANFGRSTSLTLPRF
jgi:hypothetical protein